MTWMLYGANGYTGELIAEEAARRGEKPVLAGRREDAVRPIAERLGLSWRAFGLDDPAIVARAIGDAGAKAVLHCAGPFHRTSKPMVQACLQAKAHYLDITGEIVVFEGCARQDAAAKAAGIVVLPGVGFDVVPSDCLAASLHAALPDATRLELAFSGGSNPSKGTATTMLEGLPQGGAVRVDGKIVKEPFGARTMVVPFRDKPRFAISIPWGDVSTAYHSTKIPNIVVYMAAPRRFTWVRPLIPVLATGPAQRFLKKVIASRVKGPDERTRTESRSRLWGRVTADDGRTVVGTLECPEGYQLTVIAALECVKRVLAGKLRESSGALTPSRAFGARFVAELPGCDLRVPDDGAARAAA